MNEKVLEKESKTKPQLKRMITKVWKEINTDKQANQLYAKAESRDPEDGDQIQKDDYQT